MTVFQKRLDGNYQSINVVSSRYDYYKPYNTHEEDLYWHYDLGAENPSSKVDASDVLKRAIVPEGFVDMVFNPASNPQPAEYYQTEEYIGAKNLIDAMTYWLWGDKDSGGCFAYRLDNNTVNIECIQGFVRKTINEVDNYFYLTSIISLANYQVSELFFSYDRDSDIYPHQVPLTLMYETSDIHYFYKWSDNILENIYLPYNWESHTSPGDAITDNFSLVMSSAGTVDPALISEKPEYIVRNGFASVGLYTGASYDEYIGGDIWGNSEIDTDSNPFEDGGSTEDAGGWGSYPMRSDSIGFTDADMLTIDCINSGFISLYNPTAQQILDFNAFLFNDLKGPIVDNLKKLTTEPLQYILFIALTHIAPETYTSEEISFAGVGTGVNSNKLTRQFDRIPCGALDVPEASKSYLDYGGYSKCSIYLPYIGFRDLNIDDVMGARVELSYNVDYLSGSCIAQIKCTRNSRSYTDTNINSVLYQYEGNIYTIIPITSTDWRGTISATISLIGGVASFAQGNVGGGVGQIAQAVTTEKVKANRTGSISSSYGYLSVQQPYLVLERPNTNIPTDFGKYNGYTTNIKYTLSTLSGYTEVDSNGIIANDFQCLDEELEQIKSLCEGGIYL